MATIMSMIAKPLRNALFDWHDWECITCCDHQEVGKPWLTKEDATVCDDCVSGLFIQATQHDIHYPARWGPDELDPEDFRGMLGNRIIDNYKRAGRSIAARQMLQAPVLVEGQKLGEDYQLCPKCKTAVCLEDGCNHIVCRCGSNFCFICGKEALDDGTGHWAPGKCPRYNTVGSGHEQYDEEDDDEDDFSDGEEILFLPAVRVTPELVHNGPGGGGEEENNGALEDGSIDNEAADDGRIDRNQFERLLDASYDFNVAMQTAPSPITDLLSAFLTSPLPYNTPDVREVILNAMNRFHPEYHDQELWAIDQPRRSDLHQEFLNHVVANPDRRLNGLQHYIFYEDGLELLRRPVAGFFSMYSLSQRLAACTWLSDRITGPAEEDPQKYFAWLDTLRGDEDGMIDARLNMHLYDKVFVVGDFAVFFHCMHSGILVEVRAEPSAEHPGRLEGDLASLCALLVDPQGFVAPERWPGLHRGMRED